MSEPASNFSTAGADVPNSNGELLSQVYSELRKLASFRLAGERPGQTLQATALVHEAWLRIAGIQQRSWQSRTEFFFAAATAMRRILIENARRKQRRRNLEGGERIPLDTAQLAAPLPDEELLALDAALREFARHHPQAEQLVELRFFAGLTQAEAAGQLEISRSTADRLWLLARTWLYARIHTPEVDGSEKHLKHPEPISVKQIGRSCR
jgi:RNA polymerase sigma factor (TIGR02999 family)